MSISALNLPWADSRGEIEDRISLTPAPRSVCPLSTLPASRGLWAPKFSRSLSSRRPKAGPVLKPGCGNYGNVQLW